MLTVRTLTGLRDRFPTAEERDRLTAYAESVRGRQAAFAEVSRLEDAVVSATVARLQELYPNFPRYHAAGWDKCYRDILLALQATAKSMYLDDVGLLDDQLLVWFRTILRSINFTPKLVRDAYTLLRDAVRSKAKPRTYALMEPALTHVINALSAIPEPVRPEV